MHISLPIFLWLDLYHCRRRGYCCTW